MEGNTLQVERKADSKSNQANQSRDLRIITHGTDGASETKGSKDASLESSDRWSMRIRVGFVLFAIFWLFLVGSMWSRAATAADSDSSNGEYSFKWLDPEKKIYVLQNRKYLKGDHVMLSAMLGPGFSSSYRNTFAFQPRAAYFFNENWGLEFFYSKITNSNNNTYNALVATNTNVFPVIREVRSEYGLLVDWVPWYAKLNVFNSILYFDWYFALGAGSVNTAVTTGTTKANLTDFVTQDEFGLYWATGHLYHLSETFTVRLDFMGAYYRAPLTGQTGDNVWFSNYDFTFGLGVRL